MVCDVSVLYYVSCKISLGRELHVHIDIFWVMATISACPQFRGKMLPPSSQSKHKMKAMYFFLNFFTYLPDYNIRSALFNDAVSYSMIDETNNMKHLCSDTGREHWTAYRNPPPPHCRFSHHKIQRDTHENRRMRTDRSQVKRTQPSYKRTQVFHRTQIPRQNITWLRGPGTWHRDIPHREHSCGAHQLGLPYL